MRRGIAKLLIITILVSLFAVSSVQAEDINLYPVSDNGKFYYVSLEGTKVLETSYGYADDFVNGVALVGDFIAKDPIYIDQHGNIVKSLPSGVKYDLDLWDVREISNGKLIDIRSKVKKYKDEKNYEMPVDIEEYNVGNDFVVKKLSFGGAPVFKIFKKDKLFVTNDSYCQNKDIFLIVKYDDAKMFKIAYIDYDDDLIKTTYVDYAGDKMWPELPKIKLNGNKLSFESRPQVKKGVVYASANDIFQNLGYKVGLITKTKTLVATKDKKEIRITAGSKNINIGKSVKKVDLQSEVKLYNLIVNLKNFVIALGGKYEYDSKTNTISITLNL